MSQEKSPQLNIRKSADRGFVEHGWLKSWHTFSFASYYDPKFMGFSALRVINQDIIAPGMGFSTHPHENMEIITYVLEGALEHKDSLGTSSQILPGEVQRMSAGTGIRHSEFNPSKTERTQLLQIWILPDRDGHTPSYEQKSFTDALKLERDSLLLVASGDGRLGSVSLHQDLDLYAAKVDRERLVKFRPKSSSRSIWLQIIHGGVEVLGNKLNPGDALAARYLSEFDLRLQSGTEILVFDLPEQ